jgi:excisionase family DNA binding protein
MSQLLTVEEAAKRLSCSKAAIRKWILQKRLPVVRLGRLVRVRLEDIERVASVGLPDRSRAKAA